jgi:hypothetical protein
MRLRRSTAPSQRARILKLKRPIFEFLEPRRLLTTLVGGDVFEFTDAQNNIERIRLFGDITAEVIGAKIQADDTATLINLPGVLNGNPVNGGLGAASGSQTIGATAIGGNNQAVPALASDAAGNVYYVNVVGQAGPGGTVNAVQISTVDPATGAGTVIGTISATQLNTASIGAFGTTLNAITSAAISPIDGRLYFIAQGGTANTSVLFSVNPMAGSAMAIQASLTAIPGTFNGASVSGLAFDQTGTNTANLFAANNTGVTANGKNSPSIFQVDLGNTNDLQNPVTPKLGTVAITSPIASLAFDPNTAQNNDVIAITSNAANSQVLNVDTQSGAAVNLGDLPATGQKQGQAPGGLTYDPALVDPFTGTQGALLGTDTGTRTLFYVDAANRQPLNTIFTIYVSEATEDSGISVALVPPVTATDRPMEPYTGSIGQLYVNDAQAGDPPFFVNAPANSGEALLGSRTLQLFPDQTIYDQPITSVALNGATFGVLPTGVTTLNAGLIVAPGQTLGNFLFGGTVMGQVNIGGSIDQFYCGWLLTGNAGGEDAVNEITDPDNFFVAGDIRDLIVLDSIGTETDSTLNTPNYVTGFDMLVGGTIGEVQTYDSLIGNVNAEDLSTAPTLTSDQQEVEFRHNYTGSDSYFDEDELGGQADFNNDTFATPQYLGADSNGTTTVDGTLQNAAGLGDLVDYYAVPLLAGQTITTQVTGGEIDVGIFSPENVEVASDYNKVAATEDEPFQYTATEPGVYRFAVAEFTDSKFTGNPNTVIDGDLAYTLSIKNVGNLAIGGIVATNNILDDADGGPGFSASNGDLGSVDAGGTLLSRSELETDGLGTDADAISAETGNLRAVVAGTIGGPGGTNPDITAPDGSVGLLESTSGALDVNPDIVDPSQAIGGNYQIVSSAANLVAHLIANGNIGTIRAASIASGDPSYFQVDANDQSNAGTIDLIDDAGDFGTLPAGGPRIITGPRGNVRFIHVGGTAYSDAFFGGGAPLGTTYSPGFAPQIVDDSGSIVTLTPTPIVTSTTGAAPAGAVGGSNTSTSVTNADGSVTTTTTSISGNALTQTVTVSTTTALTVTAYGIEGSGGSAIINVTNATGGLTVSGSGDIPGQTAEIGEIDVEGTGTAVVSGNTTATVGKQTIVTLPAAPVLGTGQQLAVNFTGAAKLDVFDLTGGAFTSISNTTGGEIVNLAASSIGTLSSNGSIGIDLEHNTPAEIMPNAVVENTYPFNNQHYGIVVSGSVVSINAPQVGNIDVGGAIGSVTGAVRGPIVAADQIDAVNAGSGGIYPSGTGNKSNAGIYAGGVIGPVTSSGDIRGDIVSQSGIISVHATNNASIINSTIATFIDYFTAANINIATGLVPTSGSTLNNPILTLGSITTTGNGGIIGSVIVANHVGSIAVNGGFGIFDTAVRGNGDATVQSITTSGYGLRDDGFIGGASIGTVVANGDGSLVGTNNFSTQVRYSENSAFDPFFGTVPNAATDIDAYLGTTAAQPVIPGVTDTGVIENSDFAGSRTLTSMRAFQIRSTIPDEPMEINFANSIGSITTTSQIENVDITTGKLTKFAPGGDVSGSTLTIAGKIGSLILKANLTNNSTIIASGANGNIGKITVDGNLDGVIQADGGRINNATIYGSLLGEIKANYVSNLYLKGQLGNGSLVVAGNAGTIFIGSDLNSPLTIQGKASKVRIGGNMNANVTVDGALGQLVVNGSILTGTKATITNVLTLLSIGGDFQAGATVEAQAVKRVKVRGTDEGSIVSP